MANNDTLQPQSPVSPQQPEQQNQAPVVDMRRTSAQPTQSQNPFPVAQNSVPSQPSQPKNPPPKSFINKGLLIKIAIGFFILIAVIFLITLFIPKNQSENVTLTWWGLWEDPQVVAPIIASYEKENPQVKIVYTKQEPKQYRERLLTRSDLGKGPDIFMYHNTWYPMFADVLIPLPTDVITQDEFKKVYYPVMQDDLIQNGAIYGIPMGADSLSLFVNTELLAAAGEEVPKTWEDFVRVAKKLSVKGEDGTIVTAGAGLGTFGNITHAPDIISLLFLQQGIVMKQFGSSPQDEGDALDFYVSFANPDQGVWSKDLNQSVILFSQGKLAFYFGYSWDIFSIQKLNKELAFTTYPVPSLFDRKMTVASYWVNGVSNRSEHQQEALSFMHYLAQKETAQKLYTEEAKIRAFGQPYARVDLAASLKDNKLVYPFVSQLPYAKSSFFASDTGDGSTGLNSVSNRYLENAVNGIITDGSSTKTVVETLDQGIAQIFAQYGIQ